MKAHIEYDDFGEYIEVLEEDCAADLPAGQAGCAAVSGVSGGRHVIAAIFHRVLVVFAALTVVLCTTSFAPAASVHDGGAYSAGSAAE